MKTVKLMDMYGDTFEVRKSVDDLILIDFDMQNAIELDIEKAQQLITALQNAVIELQFGGEKDGRQG